METKNGALEFQRLTYGAERPEVLRRFYEVAFGAGALLRFEEASLPTERMSAGLFHTAFLFPSRRDLAVAILRLDALGIPIEGASDHEVSEAIYLSDPEGNGIEIYADRPEQEWPLDEGKLTMGTYYLDLKDLVAQAPESAREAARHHSPEPMRVYSEPGLPESEALAELNERAAALDQSLSPTVPVIGHVHLRALDLAACEEFWKDLVGLQVMTRYAGVASFLSAGGYHHHIGVNRFGPWVPASPDASGLRHMEIGLKDGGSFAEGEYETPEGVAVSILRY